MIALASTPTNMKSGSNPSGVAISWLNFCRLLFFEGLSPGSLKKGKKENRTKQKKTNKQ